MMFELFPHQTAVIDELREGIRQGFTRQVLGLATGGGKTVVASHIAKSAADRGKRVLFVVHLTELVPQAIRTFNAMGLSCGILRGEDTDYDRSNDVIVASIQTIRTRSAPDWVELVIIDECHVLHETHRNLIRDWPDVPFIGLSATPLREGLGQHFQRLVKGPTVRWLTDQKYLVPASAYAPSQDAIKAILATVSTGNTTNGHDFREGELGKAMNTKPLIGDIVRTWQQYGENRQTLCFATNIAHSKSIVEDFIAADVPAGHLDAYTPKPERDRLIAAFKARELRLLSSVAVLAVGFDVPDAACVILARPTLSEMLHFQQLGRGIRTAEGKRDCIILDHAANVPRHGLPIHFELPDDLDDGKEAGKRKRKKKDADALVTCSDCGFVMEPSQVTCPGCGIDRPQRKSNIVAIDGDLARYGDSEAASEPDDEVRRRWYRAFLWHRQERGKSPGGAFFMARDKFKGFSAPPAWNRMKPEPPTPEQRRWIKSWSIRAAKRFAKQQSASA